MATYVSELEAAKKSLSEALGENVKQYWANLKLWFKQKISKEEFDLEARRLLTQDNVHSHNDFLLAILTRCQILVSAPEGAGSLPWPGGSATKPGKPKGKKKISSVRQKFDHRFQPQNPLSGAQQFVAKDPQEDDDLKLCSHTMMLPTRGQLEGRMIVTAYEHGLDNVTEEAVTAVVYAVENHLKDILTSVISRRKAYRLRDGHFKYAFGSNVNPQPYLKNSVVAYNNLIEGPPSSATPSAGQSLAPPPAPDDAEQQAALLLACSGDTLPASLPPVNMYDLFEALQLCKMGELFLCSKAAVIISELSWMDFDSAAAKHLTWHVPSYSCSTWVLRGTLGPGMQGTALGWLLSPQPWGGTGGAQRSDPCTHSLCSKH
ncbi:transcriptional adapter 1 isoform X1 [Motacilla alba alba]|uniref:transcriptional adapter 1 isoform X1 n=1 Tax=Motacilla alba alba TaxID=1094192 RepID=UPI0018D54351|nr:transcriptional adapter 1 isoform X1 [Motacilla alba alba]